MRVTRFAVVGSFAVAAMVLAGCGSTASDPAKSAGAGAAATSGAAPASGAAPSSGAPAGDADTKAACVAINQDIDTTLAKVADAAKIGPPAGHSAVSAQYSAGAAALYAHMISANAKVGDAAKQVATAMSDLADKYTTAPAQPPSTAALTTAVAALKAACAP